MMVQEGNSDQDKEMGTAPTEEQLKKSYDNNTLDFS